MKLRGVTNIKKASYNANKIDDFRSKKNKKRAVC